MILESFIDVNTKPNYLKITEMWAFVSVDEAGNEGIIGFKNGDTWMPLVGADSARIAELRPIANKMARYTGMTIKLIKFTQREDIETL